MQLVWPDTLNRDGSAGRTDRYVVVATPPTNNDDDGRLGESIAEELVMRARADGADLVGPGGFWVISPCRSSRPAWRSRWMNISATPSTTRPARNGGNARNGTRSKTVITEVGPVDLEVPRDRDSSFEPATVKKRQRRLNGDDSMAISLTAKGLTTGVAHAHLTEAYGTDCYGRRSRRILMT